MNISNVIKKDIIFLNLAAKNREEALQQIVDGMAAGGYVSDKSKYMSAVMEREKSGTTGIGFGVAIPHGKSEGVTSACVAYARLTTPVDWNSFDGKPVTNIFLIGVPKENAGNDHLKILIALSKNLMHDEFRAALEQAATQDEILAVLKNMDD
ncbi:MAG TPA: fructose PTS transporter subunit IIA [Caproicibacter sp.]|nr:fructose PTS transporter subunit IIA [Caproicibacter sp.]